MVDRWMWIWCWEVDESAVTGTTNELLDTVSRSHIDDDCGIRLRSSNRHDGSYLRTRYSVLVVVFRTDPFLCTG